MAWGPSTSVPSTPATAMHETRSPASVPVQIILGGDGIESACAMTKLWKTSVFPSHRATRSSTHRLYETHSRLCTLIGSIEVAAVTSHCCRARFFCSSGDFRQMAATDAARAWSTVSRGAVKKRRSTCAMRASRSWSSCFWDSDLCTACLIFTTRAKSEPLLPGEPARSGSRLHRSETSMVAAATMMAAGTVTHSGICAPNAPAAASAAAANNGGAMPPRG